MEKKELNEVIITKAIIDDYTREFLANLETDVVIVGAGPSGLVASYYLAIKDIRVTIFEKKLSVGGGMLGGGMMFNRIVVQEAGREILEDFDISYKEYEPGYYTADAIESVSAITYRAIKQGVKIFNGIVVEDVVLKNDRVNGVVINWSPVEMASLHVDPLVVISKYVVDATGHPASVTTTLVKKAGVKLNTETGTIMGEKPMWAEKGEEGTVENTKEVYPGLYVSGMAANAVYGKYRMGPVFGGMLLSGKKVADEISKKIK